eukprot:4383133-Pyramimonas_sp.AAC.1
MSDAAATLHETDDSVLEAPLDGQSLGDGGPGADPVASDSDAMLTHYRDQSGRWIKLGSKMAPVGSSCDVSGTCRGKGYTCAVDDSSDDAPLASFNGSDGGKGMVANATSQMLQLAVRLGKGGGKNVGKKGGLLDQTRSNAMIAAALCMPAASPPTEEAEGKGEEAAE